MMQLQSILCSSFMNVEISLFIFTDKNRFSYILYSFVFISEISLFISTDRFSYILLLYKSKYSHA